MMSLQQQVLVLVVSMNVCSYAMNEKTEKPIIDYSTFRSLKFWYVIQKEKTEKPITIDYAQFESLKHWNNAQSEKKNSNPRVSLTDQAAAYGVKHKESIKVDSSSHNIQHRVDHSLRNQSKL